MRQRYAVRGTRALDPRTTYCVPCLDLSSKLAFDTSIAPYLEVGLYERISRRF